MHIPFNLYLQRSFMFPFFQAGCSPTTALLLPSPQDLGQLEIQISHNLVKKPEAEYLLLGFTLVKAASKVLYILYSSMIFSPGLGRQLEKMCENFLKSSKSFWSPMFELIASKWSPCLLARGVCSIM